MIPVIPRSIQADRTLKFNGAAIGTWECTDPVHQKLTLRWAPTRIVDVLALSADGGMLGGKNQKGVAVTGHRLSPGTSPQATGSSQSAGGINWVRGGVPSGRAKGNLPHPHNGHSPEHRPTAPAPAS